MIHSVMADLVESDVSDAGAAQRVADPLRLDEDDDVDDEEAESEERPAQTEAVRAAAVHLHRLARRHRRRLFPDTLHRL